MMIRFDRKTKFVLTSLILVQCLIACGSSTQASKGNSEQRWTDNSLLWEVTSASGAVSYVFGTIHVADITVFQQRDTVLKLLDKSKAFYAELHLDSARGMGDLTTMASKMMLPEGKTLASYFKPDELLRLRKALKERLGAIAPIAENLKPGALLGLLMLDSLPTTAPMSVDEFLWKRAKNHRIACYGIERIDEQLAVLDSMPPHVLLEALENDASSDAMMSELIHAYATEDVGHIVGLVDSLSGVESYMLKINDERNVRMINRLHSALESGGAFIAVGAAHLGGSQGILAEIAKQGYTVRPVKGGSRVDWIAFPK